MSQLVFQEDITIFENNNYFLASQHPSLAAFPGSARQRCFLGMCAVSSRDLPGFYDSLLECSCCIFLRHFEEFFPRSFVFGSKETRDLSQMNSNSIHLSPTTTVLTLHSLQCFLLTFLVVACHTFDRLDCTCFHPRHSSSKV